MCAQIYFSCQFLQKTLLRKEKYIFNNDFYKFNENSKKEKV